MNSNNRTILITGSSSGIGLAIAKILAPNYNIILTGRRELDIHDIFGANATNVYYQQTDFQKIESIFQLKRFTERKFKSIDILINNVGSTMVKTFMQIDEEDFDSLNDLNYKSIYRVTNAFLDDIISNKGAIINILSIAIKETFEKNSLYSATKSAVYSMMNVLREEIRSKGVDIVNVIPGATATELWGKNLLEKYEDKMMQADDIAKAVKSIIELTMNERMTIEEIIIKPKGGSL